MSGVWTDVRLSLRQWRARPGFAIAAVLTLGPAPAIVRREVTLSCLKLTVVGVVVGVAAAVLLAQLIAGLLYGIAPADPLSLGPAVLILLAVSVAASYVPSRRAAKVEPLEALRG